MKSFKLIQENQYTRGCKRTVDKDAQELVCGCSAPEDSESAGCGENCLNRLVQVECGIKCSVLNCSNKCFQNLHYATTEVFKTEHKGLGLRTKMFLPEESFIMEYVGEVVGEKQFHKRANAYAKERVEDGVHHSYLMVLSKDSYVDATRRGNLSRFINHSCDPNAETQKWTVDGEMRIGFFTKRSVEPGEEITFDYKFERFGEAQKCFCGSLSCRGWLGVDPPLGGVEEGGEDSEDEDEFRLPRRGEEKAEDESRLSERAKRSRMRI